MKSPLHKLKEIKPLIHLNRDEAILRLFEQIYSILNEELSKYTNNKFLFIPVSGKHLHDLDGTKEHFFLTGAPIGIFNFENADKKIDAIASILSYTLYNRKHGLSATNLLSELVINESKENIVSFAKISFGADNKLEIEKNSNPYSQAGEINLNLLDNEVWQKIKAIIKELIVLENDCYVKVPNLDTVLVGVPLTSIEANKSNSHFEYIISNLYHFGNSSELKSNYYFPSFHFIEKENQPDSSYGFFVVSTNDTITGKDATDNPIEFLERVALVVFSLVGIIEQHHFVKIEQHKPLIKDIDLYPKTLLTLVEKINDKWFYSQATVDALPSLHKKIFPFGTNIWAKWFPVKQDVEFLKLYPWQWIGIGIIFGAFLICFFLLKYLFRFIFYRILFKKYVSEIQDLDKIKATSTLFSIWIGFKIFQIFVPTLFINPRYAMPVTKGINFVAASIMVFIVYKLVELFIFYSKQYAQKTATQWDDQIVLVMQKFMKFSVIFLGLFYVLNTLDVNIATIIAGLSVGGLALALAAQDTVKNFIASVMIFIDKPFKIGDTIKGDTFEGTVQEVGFRSTRIKTAEDSLVYIANAKLSEMTIDNKGYRVFKKYKTEVSFSHNTSIG